MVGLAAHQSSKLARDVALEAESLMSSLSAQTGVRGIRRREIIKQVVTELLPYS
jgi:hypothetical protein